MHIAFAFVLGVLGLASGSLAGHIEPKHAMAQIIPANAGPAGTFGTSVSVANDTLLIGAPRDQRAYIFEKDDDGEGWHERCQLVPERSRGGYFGHACTQCEDGFLVGAYAADGVGLVYVFNAGPSGCAQQANLQPKALSANSWFGRTIAASPQLVAIGSPGSKGYHGAVHLFDSKTMAEEAVIEPPGASGQLFGFAVAVRNRQVLIADSGASSVYLYDVPQDGQPVLITTAHLEENDFANALAIGDGLFVVGEPAAAGGLGAVQVYRKKDDGWTRQVILKGPGPDSGFGTSVALFGDVLFVGAPGAGGCGEVAVFQQRDGAWDNVASLVGEVESGGAGVSVAVNSHYVFVGAPYTSAAGHLAGSVLVFSMEGIGGGDR